MRLIRILANFCTSEFQRNRHEGTEVHGIFVPALILIYACALTGFCHPVYPCSTLLWHTRLVHESKKSCAIVDGLVVKFSNLNNFSSASLCERAKWTESRHSVAISGYHQGCGMWCHLERMFPLGDRITTIYYGVTGAVARLVRRITDFGERYSQFCQSNRSFYFMIIPYFDRSVRSITIYGSCIMIWP